MRISRPIILLVIIVVIFSIIIGCSDDEIVQADKVQDRSDTDEISKIQQNNEVNEMKITSPAFMHNANIPSKYTCDGQNINPPLIISDAPIGARELALIVEDPDAPGGTFTHWLAWNIPVDTKEIKEGSVLRGRSGTTDFGRAGYGGPCPPTGTHRYFFKLYALDINLDLPQGSSKQDLENALNDHIIEKAELIGLYKRNR